SAIGSILPATCTMSGCSKHRTTCAMASTSRICERNLLPSPSPCDAPATRPAMSTNSTDAGMIFCGCTMSASCCKRGSGTGTTPTFGSMVQNGKFAAAMPALVSALKSVDLPTLGRPTMPHWMAIRETPRRDSGEGRNPLFTGTGKNKGIPAFAGMASEMVSAGLWRVLPQRTLRVQSLHRLVEIARNRQRQHLPRTRDRVQHRILVRGGGIAEHPRRHAITIARMSDADAQAMKLAVAKLRDDVANAVLAAVAAVELQARGARRQIQIVVHHQQLLGRKLPVVQRRHDRAAAFVHERVGFDQPNLLAVDRHAARFGMQAILETEACPGACRQRIGKPEAGIVPVAQVFGSGIAKAGNESDASHQWETRMKEISSFRGWRRQNPESILIFSNAKARWIPDRRSRGVRNDDRGIRMSPYFFSAGFFSPAAGAAALAASPPAAGAAAPSAGAPSAVPAASAGASSTSSRTACVDTTVWSYSLPSFSSGISTPAGSFRSDTCMTSPSANSLRSRSRCSGKSFGKHDTSTSVMLCEITTPEVLAAGDFSLLRKRIVTYTRTGLDSSTRRKSRCSSCGLTGCFCTSRSSTFWRLPSTSRSRMADENQSCFAASDSFR